MLLVLVLFLANLMRKVRNMLLPMHPKATTRLRTNTFYTRGNVATPLWAKCEGEAHTPKSGNLESFGTPENSEDDLRGQISSHRCALSIIGNFFKFRCPKWPRMNHLDICSPSYGQKKGRELNWQFDSRPLKVGNRPVPDVRSRSATRRWKALFEGYNFGSDLVPIGGRGEKFWSSKVPRL
jgi:hypothetical protein